MKCSACEQDAIIFVRYSGRHLCFEHLSQFVLQRARKAFRDQYRIPRGGKVGVAISGGKDSVAALHIVKEIFGEHEDKSIVAITVDEGIEGYRPDAIDAASKVCDMLEIEHKIISFKELYKEPLDELLKSKRHLGACSYCGVLRRQAMNLAARREKASALVMGLNLDDVAQAVLMNIGRGDVERLARMGPHTVVQPGLIPRLLPLRNVPEKEAYLYCLANDLPFHDGECPYATEAQRGLYRDMLNQLEDATPGTRHAILNSQDTLRPLLSQKYEPGKLRSCSNCGEPTVGDKCRACLFVEELTLKEPLP